MTIIIMQVLMMLLVVDLHSRVPCTEDLDKMQPNVFGLTVLKLTLPPAV